MEVVERMTYLLSVVPDALKSIPAEIFSAKPAPDKWSKQEILGHLIDSAANNHQRFIRACYEPVPYIVYNQDRWNELNYYCQLTQQHLVGFWTIYNQHLLELIRRIPEAELKKACATGDSQPVTLEWLIHDYLVHMEYHLKQIINNYSF